MTLEEFIQKKKVEYYKTKLSWPDVYTLLSLEEGNSMLMALKDQRRLKRVQKSFEFIEQAIREAWNQEFKQIVDRAAVNSAELQKTMAQNYPCSICGRKLGKRQHDGISHKSCNDNSDLVKEIV